MSNVTIMTMTFNGKQYTNDLSGVKVGDKVFHVVYGECDVIQIYYGNERSVQYYQMTNEYGDILEITIDGKYDEKDYMPSVWIEDDENIKEIYKDKDITVKKNCCDELFIIRKGVQLRIGSCYDGISVRSYGTYMIPMNGGFDVISKRS